MKWQQLIGLKTVFFNVIRLFFEEGLGNEQWKVSVAMPGSLEHRIEGRLHVFPDGKPPGFDHHAAPNG